MCKWYEGKVPMAHTTKETINNKLVYSKLIEDWKGPSYQHVLECTCGTKFTRRGNDLLRKKGYISCGCSRNLYQRLDNPTDSLRNSVVLAYKTNANKKNLEFRLTDEEVISYFDKPCHYCGILNYNSTHTRKRKDRKFYKDRQFTFNYNGIDRIDSSIGYTKENCITCCKICNISKNNLSEKEFLDWLKRAYTWTFNDQSQDVGPSGSETGSTVSK